MTPLHTFKQTLSPLTTSLFVFLKSISGAWKLGISPGFLTFSLPRMFPLNYEESLTKRIRAVSTEEGTSVGSPTGLFKEGLHREVPLFFEGRVGTGDWTQDLEHAKHTIYHWAIPSPLEHIPFLPSGHPKPVPHPPLPFYSTDPLHLPQVSGSSCV